MDMHLRSRTLSRTGSINHRLGEQAAEYSTNTPYLVGNKFTVADISVYIVLRHMKDEIPHYHAGLAELKEVGVWMNRIEERESVKKAFELFKGFSKGDEVFPREFKLEV